MKFEYHVIKNASSGQGYSTDEEVMAKCDNPAIAMNIAKALKAKQEYSWHSFRVEVKDAD